MVDIETFILNEVIDSDDEPDSDESTAQPPPNNRIRINAQRFLFTYPHYNETPDVVLNLLDNIRPIERGICCLELHQDGEAHVHAAVEFKRRINSVNQRLFDLEGHHPNIQAARNWPACVNYCRKEGTLEIGFFGAVSADEVIRADGRSDEVANRTGNLFHLVEHCQSLPEWIQICVDLQISAAFCKWIWEIKNGDRPPDFTENIPLPDCVTDVRLRGHAWGNGNGTDNRSLIVCGPSGIGKTCWSMANIPCAQSGPGPHKWLLVTHIDDLRHFDARVHKSILFDEIRWDGELVNGRRVGKRPLQDQIKVLTWDTPVSIHCRYGVARIPAHVIKIFTCTGSICFTDNEQTRRRCRIMNLYAPELDDEDLWTRNETSDL